MPWVDTITPLVDKAMEKLAAIAEKQAADTRPDLVHEGKTWKIAWFYDQARRGAIADALIEAISQTEKRMMSGVV